MWHEKNEERQEQEQERRRDIAVEWQDRMILFTWVLCFLFRRGGAVSPLVAAAPHGRARRPAKLVIAV